MSRKTKQILLGYIQNIPSEEDVESFFMNYGKDDDLEVVSNLSQEALGIMTAIEEGMLEEDEMEVIREICELAYSRNNTPLIKIKQDTAARET